MMGQSRERMRSEHGRQEMADSGSSPFHPSSLVVPGRDWRQIGGGGRDITWVYTWSLYAQLVPERRLQRTQDLLDVT
jgi:hypothetical protein